MLRTLILAAVLVASGPAFAGCIGGSIGEGCIGIPTPSHRHVHPYRYEDHDRDSPRHRFNHSADDYNHYHDDEPED